MAAGKHDILIEQGATFSIVLTLQDAAQEPIDLTDYTFTGQVRKSYSDAAVMASFTFQKLNQTVPETKGQVVVTIPAAQTREIKVPSAKTAERTLIPMIYDIESVDSNGFVVRWIEGVANISPEASR